MSDIPHTKSDIVAFHAHNPDPFFAGCQATGNEERGVSFPSVEPMDGTVLFLGETAIIEAVAVLFDITVDEARRRLSAAETPKQAELTAAKKKADKLEAELAHWEGLKDALLETGLLLPTFEA
jgi:hypothetical protein